MVYSKLLDKINPNLSIKEKARSLYYNLAKNIVYDRYFMYGTDPEILNSIYYKETNIYEEESQEYVCNSANMLYFKLLQKAGVPAEIVYKKSKCQRPIEVPDVALQFFDEEGNKYFTNIVDDIENCRYGLSTVYFGITGVEYSAAQDVKKIEQAELKEIDLKTGNIRSEYSDIAFNLLIDEVKNTNNFLKFLKAQGIETENITHEQIIENKCNF